MIPDDNLPNKPEVTFDFNLPQGIESEEGNNEVPDIAPAQSTGAQTSWSFNHLTQNDDEMTGLPSSSDHPYDYVANRQDNDEQELDYRQFSPGFSDDEGSGEAFERSWPGHQAKKQAAKAAKGRKSPRRSDNEGEDSEPNARGKKPRQSLFGEADKEMEIDEQVDNLFAPVTPGHGLGNRMSSLTLDQQQNGDEYVKQLMNTGFGLACSDIGSVCDSPAPSDDEFVIPPDTVVSSLIQP